MIHTGEKPQKPYACKYCDSKFANSSHLMSHERVHTGEKPFECKYCNKKFSRKDSVKAHEKIHRVSSGL